MLINGTSTEQIDAADRGLQYGDGLFETIAVIGGEPALWHRHMARLTLGEQRLGLPPQDKQLLLEEALSLISDEQQAVLKIVITRGPGGRGYRPPAVPTTTRILSLHGWPDYPAEWYSSGIRLRICSTRIGCNTRLAGIKHLNRLEQVLARQEWDDAAVAEGLMLDQQDHVIGGTQTNLFLYREGVLTTPDLSRCGVAGVMRDTVRQIAQELEMDCRVASLSMRELKVAEALFVTNSLLGLCPVAALEEQPFDPRRIPAPLTERVSQVAFGRGRMGP